MKTADFIEEQKAQSDDSVKTPEPTPKHDPRDNLVAPWPKGVSGNPGGRPKRDVAAELARAVIEGNKEAAYKALAKSLLKGNAYVFKELAERGYGKLKEVHENHNIYSEAPDADLNQRLTKLLADLGLAQQIDDAGSHSDSGGATKKAVKAKATQLLP